MYNVYETNFVKEDRVSYILWVDNNDILAIFNCISKEICDVLLVNSNYRVKFTDCLSDGHLVEETVVFDFNESPMTFQIRINYFGCPINMEKAKTRCKNERTLSLLFIILSTTLLC